MPTRVQQRRSLSLSPEGWIRLTKLAERSGLSRTRMCEVLIIISANRAGVTVTENEVTEFKAERRAHALNREKSLIREWDRARSAKEKAFP